MTPIDGEVISLADAKAHLKVETSDYDSVIQDAIDGAIAWADGPTGVLGLALGPQTLRATWTGCALDLTCGPIQEITGVTWRDGAGEEQTLDPASYFFDGLSLRRTGFAWPCGRSAAAVTYVAGYPIGDLPKGIRQALMLQIKILYDQPEDKRLAALEQSRDALLAPVRRWRV